MLQQHLALLFKQSQMHHNKQAGVVFVVHNKQAFENRHIKGKMLHSFEQLQQCAPQASHFTPNVYRLGAFDAQQGTISGFTEKNLHHINTFVVDIDTLQFSPQQILLACIDDSIGAPTWIIQTTHGYQLYFVLNAPFFMSNKDNYRTLHIAKRIAQNLKRSLITVQADLYCNDFGFFRMPHNIIWEQHQYTYSIDDFINWSMRYEDNTETVYAPQQQGKQLLMNTAWCKALLNTTDVQGRKGQLGRNNMLFTLALVCFHDRWHMNKAMQLLQSFNHRLNAPLKYQQLETILQSAYSGRYSGPSKTYIEALLELYAPHFSGDVSTHTHWHKFKKERQQRIRSHYSEWEQDIIQYITAQKEQHAPFIWHTQKQMCEALNIPSSTLNELIKCSTQLIITKIGKGRGAKTGWTTVALYKQFLITNALQRAQQKGQYYTQLHHLLNYYAPIEQTNAFITLQQQIIQDTKSISSNNLYYYSNVP